MSDEVLIAVVSAVGLVMSGVLVELVRTRRRATATEAQTAQVVAEVTTNGGSSMRDAVNRIERDVREIRAEQNKHGQRLATVEALQNAQLRNQGG